MILCPRNKVFTISRLQGPKMTPIRKHQKKPDLEKILLYFMQKGHFWPLEARKQKKKGFLGPRNKFFLRFVAFRGQEGPLFMKHKKP